MAYSFTINHEKKYIHYIHQGIIERKEIGEACAILLNMDEFSKERFNLLSDYRGGIFNFKVIELNVIEDFLLSIKTILNGKKNAVIVDNPHNTVVSLLFENEMSKKINYHVKTFSTEAAAIRYLG